MLKYRRAFLRQRRAAVTIQAQVKGRQARAAYAQLRRRHAAAVAVQTAYRGHKVRQEYLLQRDAAIAVQMGFRRRQVSWSSFLAPLLHNGAKPSSGHHLLDNISLVPVCVCVS